VKLNGNVIDDGSPKSNKLNVKWEVLEGEGPVQFSDASAAKTTATFSKPGEYMLRLKAYDGELWTSDILYVAVLKTNTTLIKGWEFNGTLIKEGWTEEDLGETGWVIEDYGEAIPVKYVAGGYYIVVVKDATKAALVSPDGMDMISEKKPILEIRMQNHTNTTQMQMEVGASKPLSFDVVPNDKQMRVYRIDLGKISSLKPEEESFRINVGAGEPVTGTMRIDYIRLLNEIN